MSRNTQRKQAQREEAYTGGIVIGGIWLVFYFLLAFWPFNGDFQRPENRQPITLTQTRK
jgi:hypothetical protein